MKHLRYDPTDWYWVVGGSTTQVYSSKRARYVLSSDVEYLDWLSKGRYATPVDNEQYMLSALREQFPAGLAVTTIPDEITPRQAMLALLEIGITENSVLAAINSINDTAMRESARITFQRSTAFQRRNAFVGMLGLMLNLSEAQIDALFIRGAQL